MARVIGTVVVNGKKRSLTTYDYEWALKSTMAEAGTSPANVWEWGAVLWTMLHRWAGNYGKADESFGEYIQRFSQPVNLTQIGKIHSYDKTEDDPTGQIHSRERDARIRANRARAVSEIEANHPELAAYVLKFIRGGIPREPYALFADFAAGYAGAPAGATVVGHAKGNVFYDAPWIHALDVRFTKTATAAVIAAGLTLVALGAGVGYYFWLKAQKGTALGDFRKARLRKGRLTCPYCEQGIQCEMPPAICGPDDAAEKLFDMIGADKRVEGFWVFLLDPQGHLIGKKQLSTGETSQTLASPSATFRAALMSSKPVGAIITVHNHTVADPLPSQQDLNATHSLVTLGRFLKIPLVDHLIIGGTGEYTSIRDYVDSRYGERAFDHTLITPGGEAASSSIIEKGGVKGLLGIGGDID